MTGWKSALLGALDRWDKQHIVTSPDLDGLLSTAILLSRYPAKLIGFYTTQHLLLGDGHSVEDALGALWLEHDVSHSSIVCIGQHLTLHDKADRLPRRNTASFNPNVHFDQDYRESFKGIRGEKRDKYPFATCHMLLHLMDDPPLNETEIAMMAHADSTFASICRYKANCEIWKREMFQDDSAFETIFSYSASACSGKVTPDIHRAHQELLPALVTAGVTKKSYETSNRPLPTPFMGMTGKQSIPYKANMKPGTYVGKVNRVSQLLGHGTRFDLPQFGRIDRAISGEVKEARPETIGRGQFDGFMEAERMFSHAFTSKRELGYTVMEGNALSE